MSVISDFMTTPLKRGSWKRMADEERHAIPQLLSTHPGVCHWLISVAIP